MRAHVAVIVQRRSPRSPSIVSSVTSVSPSSSLMTRALPERSPGAGADQLGPIPVQAPGVASRWPVIIIPLVHGVTAGVLDSGLLQIAAAEGHAWPAGPVAVPGGDGPRDWLHARVGAWRPPIPPLYSPVRPGNRAASFEPAPPCLSGSP